MSQNEETLANMAANSEKGREGVQGKDKNQS